MNIAEKHWSELVKKHTKGGACNFQAAANELAEIAKNVALTEVVSQSVCIQELCSDDNYYLLAAAAQNMRLADPSESQLDARWRIAHKLDELSKRMQELKDQ